MSRPQVTFADPEAAQKTYLETAFTGRTEDYVPAKVSTKFPVEPLVDTTWLQVELEQADGVDYPVTERAQMRFTCHVPADRRSWAKDLASLTQALVYSQPGTESVAGVRRIGGRSAVTADPDTKNLMVWFLADIPILPVTLTG